MEDIPDIYYLYRNFLDNLAFLLNIPEEDNDDDINDKWVFYCGFNSLSVKDKAHLALSFSKDSRLQFLLSVKDEFEEANLLPKDINHIRNNYCKITSVVELMTFESNLNNSDETKYNTFSNYLNNPTENKETLDNKKSGEDQIMKIMIMRK